MRIFLLPISTKRSLIYCERIAPDRSEQQNLAARWSDKVVNKANETWAVWERAEKGWKKKLTVWGNQVFKRIPYQEWGLKSVPPLTERRKERLLSGRERVEVMFPGAYLQKSKVGGIIAQLAIERQSLHRKRFWWSVVGMPITVPVALIPVVPNVPFFYLVFRAWSHYKALRGSQHLQFLHEKQLLNLAPSKILDELYTAGLIHKTRAESRAARVPTEEETQQVAEATEKQTNDGAEDVMLLQRWNGKLLAERLKLPEMEVEIERAVEQVEGAIKARGELVEEKREIEKATAQPEKTQEK